MLSNHWRLAIRLYCERESVEVTSSQLRSVQGPFEDQMNARSMLGRPLPERALHTVIPRPTKPAPVVHEPEVDFRAAALHREVLRGLFAAGGLRDVLLLAYGFECAPRRALFGPWGNVAHLTATSRDAFAAARRRSHRRQRDLAEYLEALYITWRSNDEAAVATVSFIAASCDRLLDEADGRFMAGVRARAA